MSSALRLVAQLRMITPSCCQAPKNPIAPNLRNLCQISWKTSQRCVKIFKYEHFELTPVRLPRQTSTPAFAGAHPPQPPLTVARTVPNLAHTSRAPIPVAAQAVYQSSTAMKSIPNKSPKKQRDEWGDTSQETTQDSRQHEESGAPRTTQEAIEEDAQAMATMGLRELSAELDKSRDMSIADESYADKSAETTIGVVAAATAVDADRLRVDELNSSPRQHLDSSPQGTIRGSSAAQTMSLAPQQAQTRSVEESEEDNRLREQFEDAETQREGPLFGPAVGNQSRSELQSQSQALSGPEPISQSSQSEQHTGTGSIPFPSSAASRINERILNLTDIGGMNSSQVEQTQIEIEATQLEYDVEKLPPAPSMSAPTSGKRRTALSELHACGADGHLIGAQMHSAFSARLDQLLMRHSTSTQAASNRLLDRVVSCVGSHRRQLQLGCAHYLQRYPSRNLLLRNSTPPQWRRPPPSSLLRR